jgi:glutaredoxin
MVICPKCRHTRQSREATPVWQCPACGIAYAKASVMQDTASARVSRGRAASESMLPSIAWSRWLLVAAVILGAWQGLRIVSQHDDAGAVSMSEQELVELAATVKPNDVLIYTTTDCPYCAQAKGWMRQYGFAYTECDAQVRADCASELGKLGSGVPYLIVRAHHMKNGFDSDEFVTALR